MDTLSKMNLHSGDWVLCVKDAVGYFTEGCTYQVFNRPASPDKFVQRDNGRPIATHAVRESQFILACTGPLACDGDSNPIDDLFGGYDFPECGDEQPAVADVIHKPAHYARWMIEPITFIMRNGFEFWRGNIVKYASRAGHKMYPEMDEVQSEITDLQKVIRYAEMRINQLSGEVDL